MKHHYNSSKSNQVSIWKSLFIMMALILGCQNISAQALVTIPPGNDALSSYNHPLCSNNGYTRTGAIYTSTELGMAAGTVITSICFYVESVVAPNPAGAPVKVYMAPTTATGFSSSFYNTEVSGTTLVYSGTIPGSSYVANSWVCIPLTAPYTYTGQNLKVLVQTDAGGSGNENFDAKYFRWYTSAFGASEKWQQNTTPPTSGGSTYNTKPNAQFYNTAPAASGTLFFNSSVVTANENTTAVFTVNRVGGSTGTVSIDYATSDGTATAGLDYTATSGTLTWAAGDTAPKTINVPIAADFVLDNNETMMVTLSNPAGTTLIGNNVATLTIADVVPPMKGTYTVGVGGNYPSLTNSGGIFQAINTWVSGVSGPITINIISDISGETGNIPLNEIAGGHAVLIQPFGGSRTITGALSTTANLGLIRFEGTDNVTINGSLVGAEVASCQIGGDASLRQLTIINNSVGTTTAVLFNSSTTGAYNNTIKNVNLVGYSPSSGYGAYFRVFPHSSSIPSLVNNQNSRVENCSVKKALVGIYSSGSTTSNPNTNLVVTGNDISATGTDRVSRGAIIIFNETNPQVTFNKININNTTTDSSETVGLGIGASQAYANTVGSGGISGALVANNWITGVVSTVDLGGSTAGIAISGTAFGTPNVVQNNMISNVSGLSQYTYNVAGIWVVGAVASETKLYHNTISLYGDRGARTNQSPSYGIAISGLDPSVEMKNNIISTTQIATGGGFVKTYAFGTLSTTFANLVSDNNIFYSGGVQDGGFRSGNLSNNAGTSYATLADWRAATARDGNSIEVAPVFVAPTNLHLVAGSNPVITTTPGAPIASVTTDFDCNPRSATTPAIGAQEINVTGYSISAAAGTGGAITPAGTTSVAFGGNQSYTITASCGYAIADVLVDGVSQGVITSYTFSNLAASHTITATFVSQAPTITAGGPTTFCSGGSVVLTSSAATGNLWSTGETTQSITVSSTGNYSVSVNNSSCYSPMSTPITITVATPPAAPTVSGGGGGSFCEGGSTTLTSSVATGNVWSTGATTQSIVVSTSGIYSVSYNDGVCMSNPSSGTIINVIPRVPTPTITASGPTTFCNNQTVVLTSSSATNNVWSTGATTQSITIAQSGSYTVRVTGGCNSLTSEPMVVTNVPNPSRPTVTVTGTTTFCEGGSVTLTSSATQGNLWSNGETTQAITVTTSGVYNVTSTVNGCTSTASTNRTITVTPLPTTPTITAGGPTTFCTGGSVVLTSSSATGNTWSNGATTQSITVSASGTYSVTVTSGSCTSLASAETTVTVNAVPAAPTISASGTTTFCTGGSVTLTSSSPTGNVWSTGATTQSITVSASGNYSVSVDNVGCASGTSAITAVTVNAIPSTPTISASGTTTFCTGGSVTLTSSSATGNVWSTGATTQSITVSSPGNYSVAVTSNGCSSASSADTVVTVNAIPSTPTISASGTTTFCTGGSVTLTSSSATGNVWSTGATTQSITVSSAGNYSVAVTSNGCSSASSADTVVTVNAIPSTPTISASGTTTFCTGGSVTLTSSAATGNVWSTGATTQSITVSSAGNYSVAVTSNGCSSASSADTVVAVNAIPSTPTISASGTTTFCTGGSVTLTSSSATGNVWSTGATTQSITVSSAGNYSVAVTSNGCSSASSALTSVTVNPLPNDAVTQNAGIITATQSGATYQWYSCPNTLINGATGQTYTPSVIGDYKVEVTLGGCTLTSNCITVTTLTVKDFDLKELKLYPNPVTDILNIEYTNELTNVTVYTMLGQQIINTNQNANATTINLSGLPSATYLVKVTSENASKTFKVVKK